MYLQNEFVNDCELRNLSGLDNHKACHHFVREGERGKVHTNNLITINIYNRYA